MLKIIIPYLIEKQKYGEKTISLEILDLMLKNKKRNAEIAENYKNWKTNITTDYDMDII